MEHIFGTVSIQATSDREMVTLYELKEKRAGAFTFRISTNEEAQILAPHVTLTCKNLEGAEAVVALMKELQRRCTTGFQPPLSRG